MRSLKGVVKINYEGIVGLLEDVSLYYCILKLLVYDKTLLFECF